MRKIAKPAKKAAAWGVTLDFPQEGEIISPAHYSFRIGAPQMARVEISIDGGEWRACRPSAGYWWYDLSGIPAGAHEVLARAHSDGDKAVESQPRRFQVEPKE